MIPDNLYDEVMALRKTGTKNIWVELSKKYGEPSERLRRKFRTICERKSAEETLLMNEEETEEVNTHGDEVGDEEKGFEAKTRAVFEDGGATKYVSSQRLILMSDTQEKDPAFVLRAHGYNPEEWDVKEVSNNYWQAMRPEDAGSATLFQSKIVIKPKTEKASLTIKDIDLYFKNLQEKEPLKKFEFTQKRPDGDFVVFVPIADLHFGNGKIEETEMVLRRLALEIIERFANKRVEKIIVANMGDLMHFDNYDGKTSAGTQVGTRHAYYDVFDKASEAMSQFILALIELAPVEYVGIVGNHDRATSHAINRLLEHHFRGYKNVSFNVSFEERKYITYGKTLIGLTHGDMPQKNIHTIIQREARKQYGESLYAYMFLGHLHHINIVDNNGVITSTLPSSTPADEWHRMMGYTGSMRGTNIYLINPQEGITDTIFIKS